MRKHAFIGRDSLLSRVAVVSLLGGLVAACSSNTSRFSENPFSNPFASENNGSQVASAPVSSQPEYTKAPVQRGNGYVASAPLASSQPYQPVASVGGGGWTTEGGTQVVVAQGETLTTLSNRYGVPANAILSANGLTSPNQVSAGRNIVVPVYSVNASAGSVRKIAADPAPARPVVQPQTASAPKVNTPPVKGQANNLANVKQVADVKVTAAQKNVHATVQKPLTQPKPQTAVAQTQATVKERAEHAQIAVPQKAQPVVQAKAPEQPKPTVTAVAQTPPTATTTAPKDADQTASLQNTSQSSGEFRWPAKGRVISSFGKGGGNEGINIALPEGTPIRATESGVVTFAGDDVKSYGNLVLIKHDNGYISAYAHNGALNVKRGERVTRGQVIAKSGQTGDVTSPQLHFEIRKGQTPVDPVPYLGG